MLRWSSANLIVVVWLTSVQQSKVENSPEFQLPQQAPADGHSNSKQYGRALGSSTLHHANFVRQSRAIQ